MHAKFAVQHAKTILRTYGTGGGGVMAPSVAANKVPQLFLVQVFAGQVFFRNQSLFLQWRGQPAHKTNSLQKRFQVLVSTFFKGMEMDAGRFPWIRRAKRYLAC